MPRSADYAIQGFLYQFNKTALELLNAQDDDKITVEGIVEDIEVASSESLKAIQCKYHEASVSFTPSAVYKPLLQMLKHFSDNSTANIRYVLFAYFPGTPPPAIDRAILEAALASKDESLTKLVKAVPSHTDLDGFVGRFTMECGPNYDDITRQVGTALETNGIPKDDIETLAYPNAIHMIATLSVKHDVTARQITKKQLLSDLATIRKTAISRWTLALKTRKALLQARSKQLKVHLDKNARTRYFVIDPRGVDDYESEIVLFVTDYIDRYHFKPAHISTPVLCLCVDRGQIQNVQHRLYAKGIIANDGYVGGQFEESFFFREPLSCIGVGSKVNREFSLRILCWDDHGDRINSRKCDDLFVIGGVDCSKLDTEDVNVERFAGATFKEIKYIMGMSNACE